MFAVAILLLGLYHKTDEYTGSGCSLKKKIQLALIENLQNWNGS